MKEYEIEVTAYTTKIFLVHAKSLESACIKAQEELENLIDTSQTFWNFEFFGLDDDDHNDIYNNKFFRDEATDTYKSYEDIMEDENDFQ